MTPAPRVYLGHRTWAAGLAGADLAIPVDFELAPVEAGVFGTFSVGQHAIAPRWRETAVESWTRETSLWFGCT